MRLHTVYEPTISPGGRGKQQEDKNKRGQHLLSVRPPDMLDGVRVLRCCGLMSWLTEGSLLTFP